MFNQVIEYLPSLIALLAFIGAWLKSRSRRTTKTSQGGSFFESNELLKPPLTRPAYSDRMAYVMAEMSALAYFEFERDSGAIQQTLSKILDLKESSNDDEYKQQLENLLIELRNQFLVKSIDGREVLATLLENSGFELIETIHYHDTQGFICKRSVPDEPPYLVIAFRGSEKCVEDWLTNAQVIPKTLDKGAQVHSGFWQALHDQIHSVEDSSATSKAVNAIGEIKRIIELENNGQKEIPVYITGHSLGGALAVITTKELFRDINGACYTFGAPRLANYEYFSSMKTPIFRVVNSADIVPRVPAGAIISLTLHVVKSLRFVVQLSPTISNLLQTIEKRLDKLDDYRHCGDLRYLSDVKSGRFEDVKLLLNPPALDRIWWMYQHIRISFAEPIKSHGMAIYRKKLNYIANERNKRD